MTNKLKEIASNSPAKLKVGFLGGASYPDGTSVAAVAYANEYGSSKAPPRPFFRRMVAKESPSWGTLVGKAMQHTKGDGRKALKLVGVRIQEQLQQSIVEFTSPGLAASTIARKGFSKPLIDTSHMLDSVGSEVE